MNRLAWFLVLLATVATAGVAFGQAADNGPLLQGRITNESGQPTPGALVCVRSYLCAETISDGTYVLDTRGMASGPVRFSHPKFQAITQLLPTPATRLDVTLQPATDTERTIPVCPQRSEAGRYVGYILKIWIPRGTRAQWGSRDVDYQTIIVGYGKKPKEWLQIGEGVSWSSGLPFVAAGDGMEGNNPVGFWSITRLKEGAMKVGKNPLAQLQIPRTQLSTLVKAFKPLNARLASLPGISSRSDIPIPVPKRVGAASLPIPFSKPAALSNPRKLQLIASRADTVLQRQVRQPDVSGQPLALKKLTAARNMFSNIASVARQQNQLQAKALFAFTDPADGVLMYQAISEMARASMRDMSDAKQMKSPMQQGKLEAKRGMIESTEEEIAGKRQAAGEQLVTACATAAMKIASSAAGGTAFHSLMARVPKADQTSRPLPELVPFGRPLPSKSASGAAMADSQKLQEKRLEMLEAIMDQDVDEAKDNYEAAKEQFKLAVRILAEHMERQTQVTQKITS